MNCQEQLTCKILDKLTLNLPILEADLQKQIEIKNIIANEVYNFEVTSKCTDLVISDMDEWISYWLSCKKLKGIATKTLNNYKYLLNRFAQNTYKPIRMVNTMDIRKFMVMLSDTNGAESICNKLMTLEDFFNFVKEEGGIEKNPVSRVEKPKFTRNYKTPLTVMQQEILRNACIKQREKALFELFISSGIRVSEAANADIKDIDFEGRLLKVREGKGKKDRIVKFSTKAKLELMKYLKARNDDSEALFVTERKPYRRMGVRGLQCMIEKIRGRSGLTNINVTPHYLRNACGFNSIESGVPITSIQKLLGHSNVDVTIKHYAQTSNKKMLQDYDKAYN